jgi:hypothetical protein
MSKSLTAADRSALIRFASILPKGSAERRAILLGMSKVSFAAELSEADQMKILEQVASHFERRYGLSTDIEEEGVGLDSPTLYAWDENDEPAYRPSLDVSYDDFNGWTIGVGAHRHGFSTTLGDKVGVRDIIRKIEAMLQKEAPSLLVGRTA